MYHEKWRRIRFGVKYLDFYERLITFAVMDNDNDKDKDAFSLGVVDPTPIIEESTNYASHSESTLALEKWNQTASQSPYIT